MTKKGKRKNGKENLKKVAADRRTQYKFAFIIGIVIVLAFMFRGMYRYGMEYDEVYRINNWFPIFNKDAYPYNQTICSIHIGNLEIPLMLKSYISYFAIVPYMAVAWFENSFFVLRGLYFLYTLAGILAIYFFLEKYNTRIAVTATLLLAVNPLIFPYIRYGWANLLYGIGFAAAAAFWNKYIRSKKLRYLWLSVFVLCFQVNIQFYFMWVAAALIFTIFILYPKRFFDAVFHVKNILVIICAVVLGLINYVIYNVKTGFPTVMALWNYLFNRDKYNQNAIDNVKTESFSDALIYKLQTYLACVGIWKELFLCFVALLLLSNFILAVVFIYRKQIQDKKIYFMPGLVTIVSFALLCISPNSQGPHHLTYIVIPFMLWIACTFELFLGLYENGPTKHLIYGAAFAMTVVFFIQSNVSVVEANQTEGKDYFSSNIYDLIDYVDHHEEITDSNMLFIQWGFASQIYFMNNGEFEICELWGLTDSQVIHNKAVHYVQNVGYDSIYIPVQYQEVMEDNSGDGILRLEEDGVERCIEVEEYITYWLNEFEMNGGNCTIESTFDEKDGSDGIVLLRVDNIETVKQNIQ